MFSNGLSQKNFLYLCFCRLNGVLVNLTTYENSIIHKPRFVMELSGLENNYMRNIIYTQYVSATESLRHREFWDCAIFNHTRQIKES